MKSTKKILHSFFLMLICILSSITVLVVGKYIPPPDGGDPEQYWIYDEDRDFYLLGEIDDGDLVPDIYQYYNHDKDDFSVTSLVAAQDLENCYGQVEPNNNVTFLFDLATSLNPDHEWPFRNKLKRISFILGVKDPQGSPLSIEEILDLIVLEEALIVNEAGEQNPWGWIITHIVVQAILAGIFLATGAYEVDFLQCFTIHDFASTTIEIIRENLINHIYRDITGYTNKVAWHWVFDDPFTVAENFSMVMPLTFNFDSTGTYEISIEHEVEWREIEFGGDGLQTLGNIKKEFEVDVTSSPSSPPVDADSDALPIYLESDLNTSDGNIDSDADSIPDGWEYLYELNPNLASDNETDADNDGISNFEEYNYTLNNFNISYYHKQGLNPINNDTDYDGISDFDEINGTLGNVTDPLLFDSDNDGISDKWEYDYGLDPTYNDSSGDLDSDGLSNLQEFTQIVDPTNNDTDSDGLSDGEFILYGTNPDNNDTDYDGITDYDEIFTYNTNPLEPDSDFDDLTDYQEIFTHNSNATNNDTDNDDMIDGWEVDNSLNLTNSNDASIDSESDGIINLYEFGNSTDPWDNDTDDDSISDYLEIITYGTDPTTNDTDSDGLTDYQEINGVAPHYFTSDPLSNDTDSDNVYDYDEVMSTYGYDSDPNDTNSDTDTLNDYTELVTYGCDPMDDDTDNDGIDDDDEVNGLLGYVTDPCDEDTDGDHWKDATEINCVSDPTSSNDKPLWTEYGTTEYSYYGDSCNYINDDNLYDCLMYEDSKTVEVKDQYSKRNYLNLITSGFDDLPEDDMFRTPHSYIDRVKINFKTKFYNSKSDYDDTSDFKIKIYLSDGSTTYTWTFDPGQIQANYWNELTWTHTSGSSGLIAKIHDGYYINKVEIRVESGERYLGYSALYVDYINIAYEVYADS